MIQVDKDIPVPTPRKKEGRPPVYPFATMAVGESFVYGGKLESARVYCHQRGRVLGRKFTAAVHEGQIRIWRVS